MKMVCPRCSGTFEQRLVCPKCKVRLVLQSLRQGATVALPRVTELAAATPWSRILMALVLAYGAYFGLKQLCTAGLLVSEGEPAAEVWTSRAGPPMVLALQSIGVILGGIVVAAGQRRGAIHGFVIGTITGLLFVGPFRSQVPSFGPFSFAIDLSFLAFAGLLSGWMGMRIWKPPEDIAVQFGDRAEAFGLAQRMRRFNPLAGPVSWFRVGIGLAISIPPSIWALKLVFWSVNFSQGLLAIEIQQMRMYAWMLTAAALLAGSTIAGSAVRNSLKQGLCLAVATLVAVLGHRLWVRGLPPITWLLLTSGVTMAACLLGSWFGGQLLPPLAPKKRIQIGSLV